MVLCILRILKFRRFRCCVYFRYSGCRFSCARAAAGFPLPESARKKYLVPGQSRIIHELCLFALTLHLSMLRWLRTLPEHTYTDERMEEIHSKTDEDSAAKKPSTETNNTMDIEKSSSTGGSSDMQQITEGGEGNKSELVEKLGDGSVGL